MIFDDKFLVKFISDNDFKDFEFLSKTAWDNVENRCGAGSNMMGWLDCFENFDEKIITIAEKIKNDFEMILIIGIGGSYIGTKAAVDFLHLDVRKIRFLGNIMDSEYMNEVLKECEDKDIYLIIVSKSGETLEISVCSRIFINFMNKKYKTKSNERIIVITDEVKGSLRKEAKEKSYESFVIPSDVGGRFSILTAATLLPIACLGADVKNIIKGAKDFKYSSYGNKICLKYATIRNILYKKGKFIELMVGFNSRMAGLLLWWQQLFGESEGKDNKGIFPSCAMFSTDLHSIGQYIQEGSKKIFETFIFCNNSPKDLELSQEFSYLKTNSIHGINKSIFKGTTTAHSDGGVPLNVINFEYFSEEEFGNIIFFFEKSCAISAYILGVNPFDQPGVEAYKKNTLNLIK